MLPPSGIFTNMKKWVLVAVCLAAAGAFGDELDDFVRKDREAKKIPGMVVAIIKYPFKNTPGQNFSMPPGHRK